MMLNNRVYSVNDLALLLNTPVVAVVHQMNKAMVQLSDLMNDKEGKQFARGLISSAALKGLEIQALTEAQAKLLLAEQGGRYVPFLTTEANKALGNLINAQKPILDIIKLIVEANPNAVKTGVGPEEPTTNGAYLTTDKAVQMISQNAESLLTSENLLAAKEAELMGLPEGERIPNIGAKQSEFIHTQKKAQNTLPEPNPDHHIDRRAKMEGLDLDGDLEDFVA